MINSGRCLPANVLKMKLWYFAETTVKIMVVIIIVSDAQLICFYSLIITILIILFFSCAAAVVIAFFLCWAPYHSQRLLFLYVSLHGNWNETLRDANQKLYTLAGECICWSMAIEYTKGYFLIVLCVWFVGLLKMASFRNLRSRSNKMLPWRQFVWEEE